MSNIDKQAQKELYAKVEQQAHSLRGSPREYQALTGLCPVNVIEMHAQKIQALLDELEAAGERYEDILRQARSFREAHDSASEIIRKHERNKPTVTLPTTRLWAGKIACYEESEVVAMLERAGINIAAAGKGEAS